ncbi:MAG: GNAT family N-acetyltransferase [Candidatus Sigynarchaeota archaeon]
MLISFKACNPREFIQPDGYTATLIRSGTEGNLILATLDGSNEILMEVILLALIDLMAEGKTITEVKYKGKGARRWFQMVYPPVLVPVFFGILNHDESLIGYVVASKSALSPTRIVIGIALAKSWRGQGIGFLVLKHLQANLEKAFPFVVNEIAFETSKNNFAMIEIGKKLGFKEISPLEPNAWAESPPDRIRFLWIKS